MARYDDSFFDYVSAGAIRAAKQMLPLLGDLKITSVLDVGCGRGAWLSVWQQQKVDEVAGIDGDYVVREALLIDTSNFFAMDLAQPFDLRRRFSLVQSLEVAEHLPPECAEQFVAGLVRHSDLVLFSAAPPGQGGEDHINEQPYQYWRDLFACHGYVAIDYLRPILAGCRDIEPWYRYNSFLYASPERFASLPESMRAARAGDSIPLKDISPPLYRLRKRLIRLLPVAVMSRLARIKISIKKYHQRNRSEIRR